jgi:glucoamylase
MWLDGTAYWPGIQMDETAFPILLADALRRMNGLDRLDPWPMVRRAVSFLICNGPVTQQDRWEEDGGYSPFTLVVEIAALLAAADFADFAGEADVAQYLRETADTWNDFIESWIYVLDTDLARQHGVAGYYVRIAPMEVSDASSPAGGFVPIKNRPPSESSEPCTSIVSPDALALVRFGLRAANDPRIVDTVKIIDALLKTETATGPVWHRYNGNGYGEHADGRPFDGTGDWQTVHETQTTDTRLGIHFADLPTDRLPRDRRVRFTFFWLDAQRWEGGDFEITIAAER